MSGQEEENPEELEGQFPEEAPDIQLEETVGDLKREKATRKTAFTKVRRCLLSIIQREGIDSQEIKDTCE